jgi:hypothetical protein
VTRTSGPVTVASARQRALSVYERRAAQWATEQADAPVLDLPLHPPTQDGALGDAAAVIAWVRSWRDLPGVVWTRRRWADVGDQEVPERLRLDQPDDLARFAGRAAHWRVLSARADELLARWGAPVQQAVRRHARTIAEHDDADHARLVAVVDWLVAHPRSGLYFRQVPVAGVDTKWLGSRRALVSALVTAVTGAPDLGLRQPPGLVRLRFLDTTLAPGGLAELAAPPSELDRLTMRPDRVIVVENLESMLALPGARRTLAVHGSGYAVDRLGTVGWLRTAPITYWGDLDRDGFAILDRLRAHCSDVTSVLMDESTLIAHRNLWVADPNYDREAPPPRWERLTADETTAVNMLHELGGVRLEQERLAWPLCLRALGLAQTTRPARESTRL